MRAIDTFHVSNPHPLTFPLSLPLSHIHTHTLTHIHAYTHTHTLSLALSCGLDETIERAPGNRLLFAHGCNPNPISLYATTIAIPRTNPPRIPRSAHAYEGDTLDTTIQCFNTRNQTRRSHSKDVHRCLQTLRDPRAQHRTPTPRAPTAATGTPLPDHPRQSRYIQLITRDNNRSAVGAEGRAEEGEEEEEEDRTYHWRHWLHWPQPVRLLPLSTSTRTHRTTAARGECPCLSVCPSVCLSGRRPAERFIDDQDVSGLISQTLARSAKARQARTNFPFCLQYPLLHPQQHRRHEPEPGPKCSCCYCWLWQSKRLRGKSLSWSPARVCVHLLLLSH